MQSVIEQSVRKERGISFGVESSDVSIVRKQQDTVSEWSKGVGSSKSPTSIDFLNGIDLNDYSKCTLGDEQMINCIRQIRISLDLQDEPSWKTSDSLVDVFAFYISEFSKEIKLVNEDGFIDLVEASGDVRVIYPNWNTTSKGAILSFCDIDDAKYPVLNRCYQSLLIEMVAEKDFSRWTDLYMYEAEIESIECMKEEESEDCDEEYYNHMINEHEEWKTAWLSARENKVSFKEIPELLNSVSLPAKLEELKNWILEGCEKISKINSFEDFCAYSNEVEFDNELYLSDVGFHVCGSWRSDFMERITELIDMNANEVGLVPMIEINWLKTGSYQEKGVLTEIVEWLYKHPGI